MSHETARPGRGGTRLDVPSHPGEDGSHLTFDQLRGNSEIMPTRCAERRLCGIQQFYSTTRQWAKKQVDLEVASEVCMQVFGASTSRKRLEDKPLEAPRFLAGF